MKTKHVALFALAALLIAGTWAIAQTPATPKTGNTAAAAGDPRIDKLLQQNEQILKNQQTILDKLDKIDQGLLQVRRRAS